MGLTAINDPFAYQLSRNAVTLLLETDSYVISEGGNAELILAPSGTNTVGAVFAFIWSLDSVEMEIVSGSIDDSGTQVREKGANTNAQYAVILAEDFAYNYKLSDNYRIEAVGDNVVFTAKKKGIAYDLTADSVFTSTGFAPDTPTLPIEEEFAENYKMKADLYMESEFEADDFEKIISQELDPINNRAYFDFAQQIDAHLDYDLPTYNQTTASQCNNVIKRFFVKYLEKFGSPAENQKVYTGEIGYCLKAGILKQDYIDVNSALDFLFINTWLTRQPLTKKTKADRHEYLYYMSSATDIAVRVTFELKNKTTVAAAYKHSNTSPEYGVWCFPVGYNQMNPGSWPDFEDLIKYTVTVFDVGVFPVEALSESFTFICDEDTYIEENSFIFTNSSGGCDTVTFTGAKYSGFAIEKQTAQNITLFDTAVDVGEFAEHNHIKDDVYKISTGFINRENADWLQDFFIAEKKLWILNGKYIPVVILNVTETPYKTQENIISYEIELRIAYQNKAIKLND